jgi:hypothetical protein
MSNKNIKPEQLSLDECVTLTRAAISAEDLPNLSEFTNDLGRWIRNQCGLWEHGTDKCVADIVTEFNAGRLGSVYLRDGIFTHPELPDDSSKVAEEDMEVDRTLAHPDNCSAVIVEAILSKMDPEYGR